MLELGSTTINTKGVQALFTVLAAKVTVHSFGAILPNGDFQWYFTKRCSFDAVEPISLQCITITTPEMTSVTGARSAVAEYDPKTDTERIAKSNNFESEIWLLD